MNYEVLGKYKQDQPTLNMNQPPLGSKQLSTSYEALYQTINNEPMAARSAFYIETDF